MKPPVVQCSGFSFGGVRCKQRTSRPDGRCPTHPVTGPQLASERMRPLRAALRRKK